MGYDNAIKANLDRWAKVCLSGSKRVAEKEIANAPNDLTLCQTDSGHSNLVRETPNGPWYVHSQSDPMAEATQWFSSLDLRGVQVIYVYGLGLGYAYEAAKAWLEEDQNHYIVFIEDDLQALRHFLRTDRAKEMLFNRHAFLFYVEDEMATLNMLSKAALYFVGQKYLYTGLRRSIERKPAAYVECRSQIGFYSAMHLMWLQDTVLSYGVLFYSNYVPNFLNVQGSYFAEGLAGKFKGIPAIICGAGPSLNRNIDVLAKLNDRALIIAGGTAMNALNAKGVMPHFGAGIDPNPDQFTRLIMNEAYEIPYFYRMRMNPKAVEMIQGDKLLVTSGCIQQSPKWVEGKLGTHGLNIEEGFNVLNASVVLASIMGCNPIICVGIDLAYSEGQSYASGIESHPIHDRIENFRTKRVEEDLLTKPDIYGNPVFTLWKWIAESSWYSGFPIKHPEIKLINATEGGIGFSGVENMKLAEVRDRYLAKQYDILSLIHGEIQNTPLPKNYTQENLKKVFEEMLQGLMKCGKICGKICELYDKECSRSDSDKSYMKDIQELISQLEADEVYANVLAPASISFNYWFSLPIKQLELTEGEWPLEKQQLGTAKIEFARYMYLKNTALVGEEKLKSILSKNQSQVGPEKKEEHPIHISSEKDSYQYDGRIFKISDPEMGIDYVEDFNASPLRVESIQYPSGVLKMRSHYKGDQLHGPVTTYREDQTVLSQSWFIDGKREGKTYLYYLTGSLYGLARYRQGLKEGLQQYFYADGAPRTLISYSHGVLDGDLILYHPGGNLFRKLHFVRGKRHGLEQIWDKFGNMIVEAHYDNGRPVGLARMWYSNGILAKEILYGNSSERLESKDWDRNGMPVEERGEENNDYFDQIAKRTEVITASLDDVVNKLSTVTPMISQQDGLADQIKMLKKELDRLKEAEGKFKSQTSESASKEAIWKSPGTQDALSRLVDSMNKQMDTDMLSIEQEMKKILKKLKDINNL